MTIDKTYITPSGMEISTRLPGISCPSCERYCGECDSYCANCGTKLVCHNTPYEPDCLEKRYCPKPVRDKCVKLHGQHRDQGGTK